MNQQTYNRPNNANNIYRPTEDAVSEAQRKMKQLESLHQRKVIENRSSYENNFPNTSIKRESIDYSERMDSMINFDNAKTHKRNVSNKRSSIQDINSDMKIIFDIENRRAPIFGTESSFKPQLYSRDEENQTKPEDYVKEGIENDKYDDDDEDLHNNNIPKIMSPEALLISRGYSPIGQKAFEQHHNDPNKRVNRHNFRQRLSSDDSSPPSFERYNNKNDRQRDTKTVRRQSVRKLLGEPLPLPYLKNNEVDTTSVDVNNILNTDRLEGKTIQMNNKWRRLISQDRVAVEKRLKELNSFEQNKPLTLSNSNAYRSKSDDYSSKRQTSANKSSRNPSVVVNRDFSSPNDMSNNIHSDNIDLNSSETTNKVMSSDNSNSFKVLQDEIVKNREKLDLILKILSNSKDNNTITDSIGEQLSVNDENSNSHIVNISTDILFWTSCIILLILGNIYVYYYLEV